jgi:kumamolisin
MLSFVMVSPAEAQSVLTRHVRPEVSSGQAKFLNRLPSTQLLRIDIVLPVCDQAGLDAFLREVYDPASPSYRHFLTVPEFTARFGPTQEDYDNVVGFAKSFGLKVVGGSRDGMDVQLEGSVTSIEAAFNVSMGVYQHPTENRTFYAPDREPTVPLPVPVWHISGLDNFSTPHPALHKNPNLSVKPNTTTGSCPSSSYCGSDMRAAYYGGSLTGSGQSVGLLEYYGYDTADLNTYFTNSGQKNNVTVTGISTDGTSLTCLYSSGCDDTEQILDMTQAISMAPGLSGLYVFVGSSDTAIFSSMSTHTPLCAQLSSSWTWSPSDPSTDDPYFKKFAAQGQNLFQAAGDDSAYNLGKSTYIFPADDPNVTVVGGTDLATSGPGGSWASETAWADGGGGYYTKDAIAIPSYQKLAGVITSANQGSSTYRNSPDVAGEANFDFYVCADQTTCTSNYYGGTSFAAPMWAGYMALVNQQALANGNAVLGFINPLIYPMGLSTSYGTYFHDITSGNNGFPAVTGYDLATGWGSPNGSGLLSALAGTASAPNFALSASPGSVSIAQGSNGTTTITSTVSGGFAASIGLTASNLPSGVTAGFNPTSITGAGTSVLTLTVPSTTATGTHTITVTGTSTSPSITQTTTVSLTVTVPANPNFTISASPTSLSIVRGRSGTSTITTAVSGGFSSAVALSASGQPSGVTVSFSPASIAAPGSSTSKMTVTVSSRAGTGTHTITITGTGGGKTHTATVSLTVH